MMKLAKYVLLALLATLSVAALGGCEAWKYRWLDDLCVEIQACDPEEFELRYSTVDQCVVLLKEDVEFLFSRSRDCFAAGRSLVVCTSRKEFCDAAIDCDSVADTAEEACDY